MTGLEVRDLGVRYGGVDAVAGLGIDAPPGRLTGLIGPNGAGKTSTFNALSGLLKPSSGTITLFGHDISGHTPDGRARAGLGRTFQRMELFDALTVEENVVVGHEAHLAGTNPWRHMFRERGRRSDVQAVVDDALALCGIDALRGRRTGALSTGERRLVELARAVAGGFRILMLDEPSSGLDVAETRRFGQILRTLVDDRGVGILLVEHDMSLVMGVCDHIYVIDFGRPVFDGTPKQVARNKAVRTAYLGTTGAA